MREPEAETLALKALAYLAADADTLLRFLALSGLEVEDLRARAAEPELLAAVMDFVLGDEKLSAAFANAQDPDAPALNAIRRALPGAADR